MKTRQEIKEQAKHAFKQQRATSILLPVIVFLVTLGGSAFGVIPFVGPFISLAVSVIVVVLGVGINAAFIKIYDEEKTDLAEPFNNLGTNFLRKLGSMWLMSLLLVLGFIALIIPGFILSYSYFLTPYLLADCPNVRATDAIGFSRRMMKGHKMKVFVMHLSFIGWNILGALTFGILTLVYVAPYMSATSAGFYKEIKAQALAEGAITVEELGIDTYDEAPMQ